MTDLQTKAPERIDFDKEGLKVGLEFHQQLFAPYNLEGSKLEKKHGSKLFCPCAAVIREEDPDFTVERQLRAVSGETGEIDIAARFERLKNQRICYEGYHDTTCLVELDEEPILPVNPQAFFRSIAIAKKLFNLQIFDELLVCRKTIVDGSNTSGFQRTIQIGYGTPDSFIEVNGKKISIYQANLEEDSAKNVGRSGLTRSFRLDRLGIPLIEIATGPDMASPQEVKDVALRIGTLLRTTNFVKRGLGTIRQDINVSIKRGTRIEIKGVQELDILTDYVKNEAIRQSRMLDFLNELKRRDFTHEDIKSIKPKDISKLLKKTEAKFVSKALKRKESVMACAMPKMAGLIGYEVQPNYRIGTELSEISKVTSGAGGILHSDELPKFGISEEEVANVREVLKLKDSDGFIMIVGQKAIGENSIEAIKGVFEMWLESDPLPPEVRAPRADGTTGFLRPLPGKARMYPETDSPPLHLDNNFNQKLTDITFEMPEERLKRYISQYQLPKDLSKQLVNHPDNQLFEEIVERFDVSPTLIATTLLQLIVDIRRKGGNTDYISEDHLFVIFEKISQGELPSSILEPVLTGIAGQKQQISVEEALEKFTSKMISETELLKIVEEIANQNTNVIKEKEMGSMGTLMGLIMARVQGQVEGKTVSALVRKEIQKQLSK